MPVFSGKATGAVPLQHGHAGQMMNLKPYGIFALLLSVGCASAPRTKKVVFVIADGIPADVIEKLDPPALRAISQAGGYARAYVGGEKDGYSQTPTVSAVGYNSLLTGTWVNKHNVWHNLGDVINYNYWNIFRFVKAQRPEKKTAVFSTWLDNRTRLIGSEAKEAGYTQPDYHFDGLENDTTRFPHDAAHHYVYKIDEAVSETAAAFIREKAPDLSWVYLEYTDHVAHFMGGDGPKFYDSIMRMDKQVQRIWDSIKYRQKAFNEEWVIFVTTDHGRNEGGVGHGGQSERERTTWIVTNARGLNHRFKSQQPAIVDIMPSIASVLDVRIPRQQMMEVDGVPLLGKLSGTGAKAEASGGSIRVTWDVVDNTGMAKLWVATTNNFRAGGHDDYRLAAEVPVADGKAELDVRQYQSAFYKVAIELPHNFLNRWVVAEKR